MQSSDLELTNESVFNRYQSTHVKKINTYFYNLYYNLSPSIPSKEVNLSKILVLGKTIILRLYLIL